MNLTITSHAPVENATPPRIRFEAELTGDPSTQIPLGVSGYVDTEMNGRLGRLDEVSASSGMQEWRYFLRELGNNNYDRVALPLAFELELPVDRIHLLEVARQRNQRRDVNLRLTLLFRWAHVQSIFGPRVAVDSPTTKHQVFALQGGNVAASVSSSVRNLTLKISASDWVNDFVPKLGLSRVVTVEMPHPAGIQFVTDTKIRERLEAALAALEEAKRSLEKGEWDGACSDLRAVWEVLRNFEPTRELLEGDGYSPDAAATTVALFGTLFELASKFGLHALDKAHAAVQKPSKASKEDAEMFFAIATTMSRSLLAKAARRARTERA